MIRITIGMLAVSAVLALISKWRRHALGKTRPLYLQTRLEKSHQDRLEDSLIWSDTLSDVLFYAALCIFVFFGAMDLLSRLNLS